MAKASTKPVPDPEIQEEEEPKPAKRGRGRPKASEVAEGSHGILETIKRVDKDDWGTRVFLYVYRCAPLIDRGSKPNYITTYEEAVTEDKIMADFGSGVYKLLLTFRKPGEDKGDKVDSGFIKILNMKFPPKVPEGEWVEDPRNKEWAWAKQFFKNEQTGGTDLFHAMEALNKIQDSTTERVLSTLPPPSSGADEIVKIAKVLDVIRPPGPPPPPPDNTLATFMQAELASMRQMIDKSRDREVELMRDMIKETRASNTPNTGGISIIKEVVGGLKDLLPEVKEIFPAGDNARQRPWWQEVALLVAPYAGQFISPLGQVLAAGLANKMMQPQPGMNGVRQPNPVPTAPALPAAGPGPMMMPFLQMIAVPMQTHIRYMAPPHNEEPAEVGKDFARWVSNGYADNPNYEPAITAARAMGAVGIIAAFRSTPLWGDKGPQNTLPSLAELEQKLPPFFNSFLTWTEETDEPEEKESAEPEVLTYSGN